MCLAHNRVVLIIIIFSLTSYKVNNTVNKLKNIFRLQEVDIEL